MGTASLVRSDLALTCAHVVARASPEQITLSFPDGAPVQVRHVEASSNTDVAVLVLEPIDRAVLRLTRDCREGAAWRTFGFPKRGRFEGSTFCGAVRNPRAEKNGRPRIQLYSEDLAAGMGAPINGVSGSPIVVGDRVIGTASDIRTDSETKQALWGHVFAIPADEFLQQLGNRVSAVGSGLPPRDPREPP